MRSRAPNCSKGDLEIGRQRSEGLSALNDQFVLRRTADILVNVLPPKTEVSIMVGQ